MGCVIMDSRVEHYRKKAREVRHLAAITTVPDIRTAFLNIARQYERMADHLAHQQTHREIRVPAGRVEANDAVKAGSFSESEGDDAR